MLALVCVGCGRAGTRTSGAGTARTRAGAPPTTGACGFANCDTPQRVGHQAPCQSSAYSTAVTNDSDGGIDVSGAGCDGNHLVLNLGHRTCAGSGTSCVASIGLAFFVAQNGTWRLITYGTKFTCAFVRTTMHQAALPDALCARALSGAP